VKICICNYTTIFFYREALINVRLSSLQGLTLKLQIEMFVPETVIMNLMFQTEMRTRKWKITYSLREKHFYADGSLIVSRFIKISTDSSNKFQTYGDVLYFKTSGSRL
jgi:hypothetical protein